jgi:hypothetical protein
MIAIPDRDEPRGISAGSYRTPLRTFKARGRTLAAL